MLRTILTGLDGSPDSQAVLALGIRWASRFDALLVGIAIIDEPGIHGPEEWVLGESRFMHEMNQKSLHQATRRAEQVLEAAAMRCVADGVAFKPLEDVGDPYVRIPEESHRYDIVLLGRVTHFQFGFDKIPDDTLTRILRHSPRPVVVVPEYLGPEEAVVICFDGSPQASRALQAFEATGLARDRKIHVVSIAATHKCAARRAELAVDFLASHEINAEPKAMASDENPAALLLRSARELAAGLIVMGVHGKPLMRELIVGSTTRKVIAETSVPLFVSH